MLWYFIKFRFAQQTDGTTASDRRSCLALQRQKTWMSMYSYCFIKMILKINVFQLNVAMLDLYLAKSSEHVDLIIKMKGYNCKGS